MSGHPWLALRAGLTDLVVQALVDADARAVLAALAARLDEPGGGDAGRLVGEAAGRLRAAGILDPEGRLAPEAARRAAYLRGRCARVEAARRAFADRRRALPEAPAEVVETVALLDAGLYFEAHDRLEGDWRRAPTDRRATYQAIIQVAVALEHLARGNVAGAESLFQSALEKLDGAGDRAVGLALDPLREGLRRAVAAVRAGETEAAALVPPFRAGEAAA